MAGFMLQEDLSDVEEAGNEEDDDSELSTSDDERTICGSQCRLCKSVLMRSQTAEDLLWDQVLQEEDCLIAQKHKQRRAAGSRSSRRGGHEAFSVAFSGGGMRAAAFQAGFLWRLAQAGRLGDVERLVAVSGGAYVVSAFSSTVASAGAPSDKDLNSWYLGCVARTLCRMQRNAGYLVRDLRKGSICSPPEDDGSSRLPPVLDGLVLVLVIAVSMVINPLTICTLYLLPFTEGVNMFEGATLRAAYCAPTLADAVAVFSFWGSLHRFLRVLAIGVMLTFMVWLTSLAPPFRLRKSAAEDERVTPFPLVISSLRAVATRYVVLLIILIVIVCGAFFAQLEDNVTRRAYCKVYIQERSGSTPDIGVGSLCGTLSCQDLINGHPWWQAPRYSSYFTAEEWDRIESRSGYSEWADDLEQAEMRAKARLSGTVLRSFSAWVVNLEQKLLGTINRASHEPFLRSVWAILLFGLILALVLNAFFRGLFLRVLSLLGPVISCILAGGLVQFRIFGALAKTSVLRSTGWLKWHGETHWTYLTCVAFAASIVITLLYHHIHSLSHSFYQRSLKKAFFDGGKDKHWSDVRNNPYCPFVLFTGTVMDFRRPGEHCPISEISMSPLHTGSDRVGYVHTPAWRSLSKSAALAAAASDAFIIGMLDRARYRFWLEFLNLRMGDYILFERESRPLIDKMGKHSFTADKPFFLYGIIPMVFQTLGLVCYFTAYILSQRGNYCTQAANCYLVYMCILGGTVTLSFFGNFKPCELCLHSPAIRHLHMAMRYYHTAEQAPRLLYVTDGGVQDCTGILQLLRRRTARILLALAASDPDDNLAVLRETMHYAAAEKLASFYDPRDPRRNVDYVLDDFKYDKTLTHIVLGIRYLGEDLSVEPITGRLVVVKNRLEPDPARAPEQLLTEEEILQSTQATLDPPRPRWQDVDLLQTDLAGCCCDCCHVNMCNIGPKFPHISNANQCLTPTLFSALCRLGYRLSAEAVEAIGAEGHMQESWEVNLPIPKPAMSSSSR
eukprot:TRINITY_DN105724_c0_g1_i1.p1 TRINITY_DN105724_c0_g1~~TRINITY_DN105724_c0_g1_i1.p1  ORF type:complete len:1073 (+),score=121.40 TRINITY_DN105724_c0_g1_i1:187-3219(+)